MVATSPVPDSRAAAASDLTIWALTGLVSSLYSCASLLSSMACFRSSPDLAPTEASAAAVLALAAVVFTAVVPAAVVFAAVTAGVVLAAVVSCAAAEPASSSSASAQACSARARPPCQAPGLPISSCAQRDRARAYQHRPHRGRVGLPKRSSNSLRAPSWLCGSPCVSHRVSEPACATDKVWLKLRVAQAPQGQRDDAQTKRVHAK